MKLDAGQLRISKPTKKQISKIKRREIFFILDSVLDTYNVGGIFRLADAIGVKKVFLCGLTETPPNTRIKKASINTTEWVDWQYSETALKAIEKLRKEVPGIKVISIEQDKKSVFYKDVDYSLPVVFVVGNESTGVSKKVLDSSDFIAEIPMHGVNKSLNVIVSLAIVVFNVSFSS